MIKTIDRVLVKGTGSQAPYGMGEIITSYPNTKAGLKKAMRKAAYWYNPARVVLPSGEGVSIDWDIVRYKDKSYTYS